MSQKERQDDMGRAGFSGICYLWLVGVGDLLVVSRQDHQMARASHLEARMTPEQLAKMRAGRKAAAEARHAAQQRLDGDEHAQWLERHQRALEDHRRESCTTSS